jgi:AraC family transcriptional activator of pobA
MAQTPPARAAPPIPTHILYADEGREPAADLDFVHIETIKARAGLHNWEIRPHRHVALHQFLILVTGGGQLDAEGSVEAFAAPVLIAVPANLVHGFAFTPEADGFVLTVAERFLEQCAQRGFEPPAYPTRVVPAPLDGAEDRALLQAAFEFLHRELPWRRAGHARATAACIDLILVALSRRMAQPTGADAAPSARRLSHNFKQLVNAHAAEGWSVQQYAAALAVSVEQLNRACRATGGRTPLRIVHDRLMAEAKRSLIYTAMSVYEIGFSLGFNDPAYFTRFFVQREGCAPSVYRRSVAQSGGAAADGRRSRLTAPDAAP